jgi:hypothetical protein
MIVVSDNLDEGILLDIELARADLREAEAAQRLHDGPAARNRLDVCRATVDTFLDMWIEAGGPTGN